MKTVFKSTEIAHVWAHKGAPYGRSPSALSFSGDAILSYSTEIARRIERKGKTAYILNTTGYSVTTSKHESDIRSAIRGETVFKIGGIRMGGGLADITGKELYDYAVEQAADCQKAAAKARKRGEFLLGQSLGWLEDAKEINAFFGLRRKVDEKAIERLAAARGEAERKEAAALAARQAKQIAEYRPKYEAWLAGEHEIFPTGLFPVAFRVEGDELVSTLGARVPLEEARRAYTFATSKRGQAWRENGERCPVGMYRLDAINEAGIVAGCHRISWAEIDRLAPVLSQPSTPLAG